LGKEENDFDSEIEELCLRDPRQVRQVYAHPRIF
jgi:hypothetical protein